MTLSKLCDQEAISFPPNIYLIALFSGFYLPMQANGRPVRTQGHWMETLGLRGLKNDVSVIQEVKGRPG